ncbi:VAMP-like protein YKT61 [Acorus calamus]|uniref:VAMP-like protein YKT61 n=1 Tax=Acorus calamus TaxID=4465 RepID=A0AAV9EVL4_ACOCL|nr:VAMP-like protein YKT61 [Acorus calamus]
MKITAILVMKSMGPESASDPVLLANESDLSQFGFFHRGGAKEFIFFVGRTVAMRTPLNQRQSVQHEVRNPTQAIFPLISNGITDFILSGLGDSWKNQYKVHAYNRNGLCVLAFMDDHYPMRSAFFLLNKIIDEYQKNFGDSWKTAQTDSTQPWPYLKEALSTFQDPAEADTLTRIQRDLDETTIILHQTIDSVLARGEKLDSLVEKSSDLSAVSQMFYKQAKRNNQCCTVI